MERVNNVISNGSNNLQLSQTRSVIFILLFAGCISILVTTTIINKNAIIASIVGYCIVLAGLLFVVGYVLTEEFPIKSKAILITATIFTIGIVSLSIHLFNKYVNEISKGHIPYLTTFSFLSVVFIIFQLFLIKTFLSSSNVEIKSFDGAKLYGFNLVSLSLLICMYISLHYYLTDG